MADNINMEQDDAVKCALMCMELGAPHPEYKGALRKAFPGRIILEGGPLKLLQDLWRKYHPANPGLKDVGVNVNVNTGEKTPL